MLYSALLRVLDTLSNAEYNIKYFICVQHDVQHGVQHDGRLLFWKAASVFAHYVRIVIVFAIGEINILFLL